PSREDVPGYVRGPEERGRSRLMCQAYALGSMQHILSGTGHCLTAIDADLPGELRGDLPELLLRTEGDGRHLGSDLVRAIEGQSQELDRPRHGCRHPRLGTAAYPMWRRERLGPYVLQA